MHGDGELRPQLFGEGLRFGGLRALIAGHIKRVADDRLDNVVLTQHPGDGLQVRAAVGAVQGEERLCGEAQRVRERHANAPVAYVEADDAGGQIASRFDRIFRFLCVFSHMPSVLKRQGAHALRCTRLNRMARAPIVEDRLGLIAGNGRFPFLLLDAARAHGLTVVVAAIKEETDPEIDERAAVDAAIRVHWLSLGELSRLIETFHAEGVGRAVMAGQVKHKQIFSSIRPDWRLAKLLLSLRTRNTDMLLGAIAKVLGDEGIELISSTQYLDPLLAKGGVLTFRAPSGAELADIAYGQTVARGVAGFDLGQTVVIAAQACVAVEAMEGTDATIARAGALFRAVAEEGDASTLSRSLTVVKVAKPNQDMRFDVPVIGLATIETMAAAGATCLSLEAGRTLIFDLEAVLDAANKAKISIAVTT